MIFKVAIIADLHFGAQSPKQLYSELETGFLDFIKDRYLDMIVIAGDFYNSVISLNSQTSIIAFKFMNELIKICETNGIRYIRILEGTLSHDNFQIRNFSMYEANKKVDVRIITTVRSEVLEGMNILYIPEEYMEDPKSYYDKYFNVPKKYYDFIFGHGMFKEVSFVSDDGENAISQAPVMDSKLIGSICKGPIFFGHIHTPTIIRNHIYYVGSYSRWVYGQEEDKGFYICVYDTDSYRYMIEFIVNRNTRQFDTVKVVLDNYNKSPEELIAFVKQLKRDNLRIQLIAESGDKDFSYFISFLKEYYTGKQSYKLDIVDKREKLVKQKTEERVKQIMTDYNFLFDKSLPVTVKIQKYIKRKYSKDISEEFLKNLLNLNVTKINQGG